jgi:DNA-directed RNA polymerase V subunit 1
LLRSNFINDVLKLYLPKDFVHDSFTDLVSSVLSKKGSGEVVQFLDRLQPVLMESLILEDFSVSLKDFNVPKAILEETQIFFRNNQSYLKVYL